MGSSQSRKGLSIGQSALYTASKRGTLPATLIQSSLSQFSSDLASWPGGAAGGLAAVGSIKAAAFMPAWGLWGTMGALSSISSSASTSEEGPAREEGCCAAARPIGGR
jgi:hypothetical protein